MMRFPERKPNRLSVLLLTLLAVTALWLSRTAAQELPTDVFVTADGTGRQCPVVADRAEPRQITNGESRTITVYGSGFSPSTAVRLGGFGILLTSLVNSNAVTAEVPAIISSGTYNVRIVDPSCDEISYSNQDRLKLVVNAAPSPTQEPIEVEPPTEIPGSPLLIARSFTASPALVVPGGTVLLVFELYNQGSRTAESISVTVDTGGAFLPAPGQATATLPNIPPGGSASGTLTVSVAQTAEPGPASVPITINYRDFAGESYEANEAGSVTIEQVIQSTQIVLSQYPYDPNPAIPGEPLTITLTVTNTGNTAAQQALLTVSGDDGVLLAGPQGDSAPLMDLQSGASATVALTLVVSPEAKPGPQSQSYTISYILNGEAQTFTGRLTINVARVAPASPTMLLQAVGFDKDPIKPGDQFELTVELKNVGKVAAQEMLVTFGTVEDNGGDDDNGNGGGSSTTPSTTFAPLGSGGTLAIGDVEAGDSTTFNQVFIVNGTTVSGIYSLPITLRYQRPDGTDVQDNLRATVVVIRPPPLRVNLQAPPLEFVTVGEPITLAYDLLNGGSEALELTNATTETETGDVVEGAATLIGQVPGNDQAAYTSVVIPYSPGTMDIIVTIRYLDDLNNEREIVNTYQVEVSEPPPFIEEEPTPDLLPTPTEEPEPESDWVGRLLLGLLGLGS